MSNIEYRYERKFCLNGVMLHEIENIIKLHPSIFRKIYYERDINNIYFDTTGLSSFKENIDGVSRRQKTRIRWYGDLFGANNSPVMEIKNKIGALGWKDRFKLNSFSLHRHCSFNYNKVLNELKSKYFNAMKPANMSILVPTLLNRYHRSYYLSFDCKFRITVDTQMEYYSINPINQLCTNHFKDDNIIIELKYDQKCDINAGDIVQNMPFRISKSSKYVTGIEKLIS